MKLVLASASAARRALLRKAGIPFEVDPSGVPEHSGRGLTLRRAVLANAGRKALAVARRRPLEWVLAADTMIEFEGRLYGKPASRREAVRLLARMAGRWHVLATGVVLIQGCRRWTGAVRTRVRLRPLSAAAIAKILRGQDTTGAAGGYRIRKGRDPLIERIEGSFSNVVGLPLEWVTRKLSEVGFRTPHPSSVIRYPSSLPPRAASPPPPARRPRRRSATANRSASGSS